MSFKKGFVFFLLSLFFCGPALAAWPDRDIVILYTNDVHCGVGGSGGRSIPLSSNVDEHIGYAGLAFYRDEMKKHTPWVTLVDAGDAVQGGGDWHHFQRPVSHRHHERGELRRGGSRQS